MGHATVVGRNPLQEIVIYIKPNPEAEEREFILDALLHVLLDGCQLQLTLETQKGRHSPEQQESLHQGEHIPALPVFLVLLRYQGNPEQTQCQISIAYSNV